MDEDTIATEEERRMELEATRRQDAAEAEAAAAEETPDGEVVSGETTREFGTPLLLLGAAKDTLDWVVDLIGIGEIPFIGQIPGILFTLFIALYLIQKGLLRQNLARRATAYAGFIADNLPLINNIPLLTPALWILRRVRQPGISKNTGTT